MSITKQVHHVSLSCPVITEKNKSPDEEGLNSEARSSRCVALRLYNSNSSLFISKGKGKNNKPVNAKEKRRDGEKRNSTDRLGFGGFGCWEEKLFTATGPLCDRT